MSMLFSSKNNSSSKSSIDKDAVEGVAEEAWPESLEGVCGGVAQQYAGVTMEELDAFDNFLDITTPILTPSELNVLDF